MKKFYQVDVFLKLEGRSIEIGNVVSISANEQPGFDVHFSNILQSCESDFAVIRSHSHPFNLK